MTRSKPNSFAVFNSDTRGNVAMLFGVMSLVLCGAVASAVDFGRSTSVQRKLQSATDAAALAAATMTGMTMDQRLEMARQMFEADASGALGNQPSVSVSVDTVAGTVAVLANSQVPMTFMKLLGVDSVQVSAKSSVVAGSGSSGKKLEVAMMIDLTGSMGGVRNGVTKIDALKSASADLIDILFPNNQQKSSTTRVAIAPMADFVNAGPYAAAVTGFDPRGPFDNKTNLKSTKHGNFSGSYAGSITGGAQGSQHGATSVSGASAGATFDNGHCAIPAAPGVPVGGATYEATSIPVGASVTGVGAPPPQLIDAGATGFYKVDTLDNTSGGFDWEFFGGVSANGIVGQAPGGAQLEQGNGNYYIPIPAAAGGVTYQTDTASGKLIGVPAFIADGASSYQPQIQSASAAGGYVQITGFDNGNFTLAAGITNTGYFIPVPVAMTTAGGTLPECTSDANPNDGFLVSCVTERPNATHRNDDELPAGADFLGPFNQSVSGAANKPNYSEDGACMTSGRELPAVIPLTNDRATLETFFDAATIGGSTPGHLGHAWAWYMLSPKWNSIWPNESQAAEYTDKNVMKAAIIMTDGEYNTQYTDETSKAQALALCNGMRQAGIKVFTIGFGFTGNAADTAAADTLKQCVNNEAGSYFLAYDGDALRQAFKDIGQKLKGAQIKLMLTN